MSYLDHSRSFISAQRKQTAGPTNTPRSAILVPKDYPSAAQDGFPQAAPADCSTLNPHHILTTRRSPASPQQPQHKQHAVHCLKPLPSVPQDVDADESLDFNEPAQTHHHRPALDSDNNMNIDSDISSASASSTASSSREADWLETSLRNQVSRLHIQYTDVDLTATEAPSVFGLRRRIVAAVLDHAARCRKDAPEDTNEVKGLDESGLSEWLAVQPSNSQRRGNILRKKLSFGRRQAKAAYASQNPVHDPMPSDTVSPSDSTGCSRSSSIGLPACSHDKMLKRDKELAEREANFDLVVLSRFEVAELKLMVYTEHRQGSWVVKGPADPGAKVLEEPPLVYSPWDCQIDSCAIVERKKLRSFVELSDTTCAVRCTTCSSPHHRSFGHGYEVHESHAVDRPPEGGLCCKHCGGTGAVQATYVVCVTLRQSTFLPLILPARHKAGKHQNAFRSYLPKTTKAMSHVDILRMRSLEIVRSCALRVGRAHHKEHDARLLMAKALLERRSCNSVAVINRTNGIFRTFDITDGGFVRVHAGAGLSEEESRITETTDLATALSKLPITATVSPEGTYRFVDLELVDMATSKNLTLVDGQSRSPSIYTSAASTNDSFSPSELGFIERATGQDSSRDSHTIRGSNVRDAAAHKPIETGKEGAGPDARSRWQLPPLDIESFRAASSLASSGSPRSSLRSFQSAQDCFNSSPNSLPLPKRPWVRSSKSSTGSFDSSTGPARDSVRSMSSRSSGTLPGNTYSRAVPRIGS